LFNRLFYILQRIICVSTLKLVFRFKVHGQRSLPSGPLIVAANHESLIDPPILQAALKRRVHFLMTSDFYFKPVLNQYSRLMRCIPVMENRFNREAIRAALEVLKAGRVLAIFPQGGIKSDDDLHAAMRGIALLAEKSGAPVLPVRLRGTAKVLPKGSLFIRPAALDVHIGPPIKYTDTCPPDQRSGRRGLENYTRIVMDAIAKL